ncbi:MAG: winged helix-turn-helix domain-containing protein [Bryobacterales bacterium]|nr:winged helix-turn-helix domain-containing protein [Bryobacterales bacterium]
MSTNTHNQPQFRFGVFDVDVASRRLRKHGLNVRLQLQPFRVLVLMLAKPGELVTREELQRELWPGDTFVEFEQSLNAAVRRLRAVLGDTAEAPRYIETVPKQGYRFIAPVHVANDFPDAPPKKATRLALLDGAPVRDWRRFWPVGAFVGVLLAIAAALALRPAAEIGTVPAARIYTVETDQPPLNPSVSPDGQYIAYFSAEESASQLALYIRNLTEPKSRRIGVFPVPFPHQPVWSPDGRFVAAVLGPRTLFKVSVSGAEPTPVIQLTEPFGWRNKPVWNPRTNIFLSGLEVDEVNAKLVPVIAQPEGDNSDPCNDAAVVFGRNLFFCGDTLPGNLIRLIDDQSNEIRRFEFGSQPVFSPSGHLVYSSEESLWAVPLRGDTFEPEGAPVRIARDASDASFSNDGGLVFLESTGLRQQLVWKSRSGQELSTVGEPQWLITQPNLHPESGRILTRARQQTSDEWSLWLHDPALNLSTPIVIGHGGVDRPRWAPGGDQFTYSAHGEPHIQRIQSPAQKGSSFFKIHDGMAWIRDWCPSRDCLIFTRLARGNRDLWVMADPLKDSRSMNAYLETPQFETSPVISPDGKYVAYQARRFDQFGVYVNTFPVPTREVLVVNSGAHPIWRSDGKEIFYVEDGRFMMGLPVNTDSQFEVTGPAVRLFEHKGLGNSRSQEYDVSPDGQRFLVVKTLNEPKNVIRVVQNWLGLLQ